MMPVAIARPGRLVRAAMAGVFASALLLVVVCTTSAQMTVQPVGQGTSSPATDTSHLQPVVVTATRVPFAQAVPTTSATVITGAELQARGIVSVSDALRDVAGADPVQTGSVGGVTSLFFRGGESDYVKVLLDGVPLNQPGGALFFQNLTTADIDRIEIVRGPTSVLYGSDAMTGVIQIFTKRGSGAPQASLDLNGGTDKSFNGSADLAGSAGPVGYSLGGTRETTEGILPFNNQYTNGELAGHLDFGRGTSSTLSLNARYHTTDYHYPTISDGTPVDSNQHRRDEGSSFALDAGHAFTSGFDGRVSLSMDNADAADINPQDDPADTTGTFISFDRDVYQRLNADLHFDARAGRAAVVTVGGSLEGQRERDRSFDVSNFGAAFGGIDTSATGPVAYFRRIEAGYAQVLANAGSSASFTAGARLDHDDVFGTYGTYRVGAGFLLAPATQVHAQLGTSFKEPTFAQNFSTEPFVIGNPSLKPEHSLGWEAGITEAPAGSHITVSATYFNQLFHNIIDYSPTGVPVPGHPADTANYVNIAGAIADGVELGALVGPITGSTLNLEYTYLDTRVTDNGEDTSGYSEFRIGTRLIRRPTDQFSGTLSQQLSSRGFVSGTVRFVGTRDDVNFNALTASAARVVLPGYTTVDLAAEYGLTPASALGRGISVTARVTNLLNRQYDEVYSYGAPGRIILVGLRFAAGGGR